MGNRAPLPGHDSNVKTCPLCSEVGARERLLESHIAFGCKRLRAIQEELGLRGYARSKKKAITPRELLWQYLRGDKCDPEQLLGRGRALSALMVKYYKEIELNNGSDC